MSLSKGQKVVCIDDSIKADQLMFVTKAYGTWVKRDSMYTIREVLDNDGIVTGLLLDEIRNGAIPQPLLGGRWQEPAFRVSRFAPMEVSYEYMYKENYDVCSV